MLEISLKDLEPHGLLVVVLVALLVLDHELLEQRFQLVGGQVRQPGRSSRGRRRLPRRPRDRAVCGANGGRRAGGRELGARRPCGGGCSSDRWTKQASTEGGKSRKGSLGARNRRRTIDALDLFAGCMMYF